MITRLTAAVAAIIAATALAVGCGDDGGESPSPAAKPGGPVDSSVSFSGERLPGTLYLVAGQDGLNAELYRSHGELASAEQITTQGRVSSISGHDGTLAVSNAAGSGTDRLELANLRGRQALPGKVVDPDGQAPQFSPSGKLLYHTVRYAEGGDILGENVYVTDAAGDGRKLALRTGKGEVNVGWGPDDRIAAVFDNKPVIVVDPGGRDERRVRTGLREVTRFGVNAKGDLFAIDGRGSLAVIPRDGRARVFDTGWPAGFTWAPDGSSVLVGRGDRLGLLSPADGSVREVARVKNGEVFGVAWVATES